MGWSERGITLGLLIATPVVFLASESLDEGVYYHLFLSGIAYEQSLCSLRLAVRTLASHAGNRGSIPLGSTNFVSIPQARSDLWEFQTT